MVRLLIVTTALFTSVKMRKVLLPFTVTAWGWSLLIIIAASGMFGSEDVRLIVKRFSAALYPGSLVGMLKATVFASAFAVASMIACRRLPKPPSAVVVTDRLAACALMMPNSRHIPTKTETFLEIFFILVII